MPIPADAEPANCSDKNFAVQQRQPDGTVTLWEFWSAHREGGGWSAGGGGVTQDMQHDRGYGSGLQWRDPQAAVYLARASTNAWNVTASSASMVGGVITTHDVERGRIDHALAFATPDAARAAGCSRPSGPTAG